MTALLHEIVADFAGLVSVTADRLRIDAALVEKDYWATEALRAISSGFPVGDDGHVIVPVFKGGTSLSKAVGIIGRFSDDGDLVIPVLATPDAVPVPPCRSRMQGGGPKAPSSVRSDEHEHRRVDHLQHLFAP